MQNIDECTLAERVASGDAGAMRLLYDRYVPQLASVCARYIASDDDVKDVLQDSFVAIFTSMGSFRYKGEGSLRAWMSRIVANRSINALRSMRRTASIETTQPLPDVPDDEGEGVELDRVPLDEIHAMIRQLPEGYRAVFNMSVMEHYSHSEIAALLGVKNDSVASQLHRAKAQLAQKIKDYIKLHNQ